jgi:putative SOS response-associated peptidase YedK
MSTPTLLETFSAVDDTGGAVEENYNVAPTDPVPVVLVRRNKETDEDVRLLRVFRWGLVPSWAKDTTGAARLINARLETLTVKPAFRKAVSARRCIVPADGYYEWLPPAQPRGKKLPVYISRADGGALAMAGIYEVWSDAAGNRSGRPRSSRPTRSTSSATSTTARPSCWTRTSGRPGSIRTGPTPGPCSRPSARRPRGC